MKRNVCGIYCIENIINNKKWIGYSKDIGRRWSEHKYDLKCNKNSILLQSDYNFYGVENFKYYIMEEYDEGCNKKFLEDKEKYFIELYKTKNPEFGYNLTEGGCGLLGFKFNEESLEKKSKSTKGRKGKIPSIETRKRIGDSNRGRVCSEESKEKSSLSHMGRNYNKGIPKSEEFKKHLSEVNKGKKIVKTSKYIGVSYEKKRKKYKAQIRNNGEKIFLGLFKNEIDAALAYNKKAIEIRGENAKINIIEETDDE